MCCGVLGVAAVFFMLLAVAVVWAVAWIWSPHEDDK